MKTHIAILIITAGLYYISGVVFAKGLIYESYGLLAMAYVIAVLYVLDSFVGWVVRNRG